MNKTYLSILVIVLFGMITPFLYAQHNCGHCSSPCEKFAISNDSTIDDEEFLILDDSEFNDTEFQTIEDSEFASIEEIEVDESCNFDQNKSFLIQLLILALLLIFIGSTIQYRWMKLLRPFFLLVMLVWLGFSNGGCPCMISSFTNTVLVISGHSVDWIHLLWFLGLIPLTYFLGRIWCGWLCHLGALQEFIFKGNRFELFKSLKAQRIMRTIQIIVFVIWVLYVAISQTNFYCHYDPFKVAFNLFSSHHTGYILLGILLISSLFINRPFCRTICPVGFILGLISYIPFARRIRKSDNCIQCKKCTSVCPTHAITYNNKKSSINTIQCIACGECLDSCYFKSLTLSRKQKNQV